MKYVASLSHVREVSLVGTADRGYWQEKLAAESLSPAEVDGRAQVLITTADARFWGLRFSELSFCILVAAPQGSAAYLAAAFNTNRFFAFSERTFFSTPYCHGEVRISTSSPASIELALHREVVMRAQMHPRAPSQHHDDGWEGPVYLPGKRKLFHARLRGSTEFWPFLPSQDAFKIEPAPAQWIFQALIDSQFEAKQWMVRSDATHQKSKTYKRDQVIFDRCAVPGPASGG